MPDPVYFDLCKKEAPGLFPQELLLPSEPCIAHFPAGLKICAIETHVADARSCCLHPASSTHRQMTDAELAAAGIAPNMVRLSCGLESADDLIADVAQALELA